MEVEIISATNEICNAYESEGITKESKGTPFCKQKAVIKITSWDGVEATLCLIHAREFYYDLLDVIEKCEGLK